MTVPPTDHPRVLLDGLAYCESPRWHDGRLWFAHWGAGEVVAVDLEGKAEVMAAGPAGLGWSIDFLPDGRLLVTGERLLRHEPDGSVVPHADVGGGEIVVDAAGYAYVNGFAFDFIGGDAPSPGWIDLVTPDGAVRRVADGLRFPNGMVITPDGRTLLVAESFAGCITAFDIDADGGLSGRRVWADGLGPDGITLDAAGAVWTHQAKQEGPLHDGDVCVRVLDGEVTHRVPQEQFGFAAMLGGPDGRSLFLCDADWRGIEGVESAIADRTGRILVADAPEPRAGWPGGSWIADRM